MGKKTVEVPGIQQPQSPREINGGWIIAIATVVVIGLYIVATKPAWLCGSYEIGRNTTSWQVSDSSTLDAQILWQKAEIPGLHNQGVSNSTLAASNNHLLVGRDSNYMICDFGNDVVAFDRMTGEKDWSVPASAIKWIEPIESGYLILYGYTNLAEINVEGRQVWYPPELPSKSAYSLFVADHNVYLPSYSTTFFISNGSRILNTIEGYQILAIFNNLVMRYDENGRIEVLNADSEQELWSLSLPEPANTTFFPTYFPLHIDQMDSTVLIYYGSNVTTSIEAYEMETGELLWKNEQHFDSVPILLGNMIVAYSFEDGLLAYDAHNGSLVGEVMFTRTSDNNDEWNTQPVWIAGYDNTIAIMYRGSGELVTLQLDL